MENVRDIAPINEAVKRNIEHFPESFCFKLTYEEYNYLKSQIATSNENIIKIIQVRGGKQKILIIDNYIEDTILEMLAKKNEYVEVVILTSNNSNISKLDIQKFNKEYPILKVAKTNKFHDRFIVIDNKELYHCGASLKDLGKKCFGINKIDDIEYIEKLNDKVKKFQLKI